MHIRVLLSKYRAYTPCAACGGARLKPEALLWRVGTKADADAVLAPAKRYPPRGTQWSLDELAALPGLHLHDLMLLPIERGARRSSTRLALPAPLDEATELLLDRDPRAASLPVRGGPGLPHARPPVAHALRRRGAAHQPHHGARHLAGEHAVRARRAVDRPASARHGPRDRRDAAAARRRQLAGGGRARPADHARGRPPARHGPGPGRARRRDRVLRHARTS